MDVEKIIFKFKNKFLNKIVSKMQSTMLDIFRKEIKTYKGMLDAWFVDLNHAL